MVVKRFIQVAAAALVALPALAASTLESQAQWRGGGYGWRGGGGYYGGYGGRGYGYGYGGGIGAGLLAGALIGAAPYYGRGPYYASQPYYGDDCFVVRRRVVDHRGRVRLVRRTVCE